MFFQKIIHLWWKKSGKLENASIYSEISDCGSKCSEENIQITRKLVRKCNCKISQKFIENGERQQQVTLFWKNIKKVKSL